MEKTWEEVARKLNEALSEIMTSNENIEFGRKEAWAALNMFEWKEREVETGSS